MRSMKSYSFCNSWRCSSRDFKRCIGTTPPLKIPLGRAVGCLNESQNIRPTYLSENLKNICFVVDFILKYFKQHRLSSTVNRIKSGN